MTFSIASSLWLQALRLLAFLACAGVTLLPALAVQLPDTQIQTNLQAGQAQKVVVIYKETATQAAEDDAPRRTRRQALKNRVLGALSSGHIHQRRDFSELPLSSMTLAQPAALRQLLANPDVEAVVPDKRLYMALPQSLPLIGQSTVSSVMDRRGAGVGIAVIDTGLTYTRSEFGSCTAPGAPAATCRVSAVYEAATNDNALDSIGHGTQVAMIALATAPQANIIGLDVFDGNSALTSDVLEAINWVVTNRSAYNIQVINMSLGDGVEYTSSCASNANPFFSAIRSARNAGILVAVAAGNEGYTSGVSNPACVSTQTLAVGAVYDANVGTRGWVLNKYNSTTGTVTSSNCFDNSTSADMPTCFSNSSSLLDLWAPGAMITVGGQETGGTSTATPFVSGAAAILRAQFPTETVAQIEARLTGNGPQITDTRNSVVKRRLDLLAAQGAPANDAFESATAVSGNSGSATGWNHNATAQSGEPSHAGQTGSRSVWWAWTAPGSGTLTLNTQGSAIDTLLGLYQGTSVSALSTVASDDDSGSAGTSALTIGVVSGQTYFIAIDGKAGVTGALSLAWAYSTEIYQADLSITLSPSATSVWVDSSFTLGATVHNAGSQAASGTTLTLTVPASLAITTVPGSCTVVGSTINCTLGSLAVGADVTLSFGLSGASEGLVDVSGTAASTLPDTVSTNNSATAQISVQQPVVEPPTSEDGDVPLPGWALLGLGSALWSSQRLRSPKKA
jgi:Subtilase family/Domain of unknown function DUF11